MRAFLLLLFAVPLHAADDDKEYYPLRIGTKWTYRLSGQEGKFVIAAVGEEKIGNVTSVKLEAKLRDQAVGSEQVAFQNGEFIRYKFNDQTIEPPIPFCKPAAKKGDKWNANFKVGGAGGASVRYETDTQDVKVPAGEFKNALVVKADVSEKVDENGKEVDRITKTTIWYVKGKGVVKQFVEIGPATVTLELESVEEPKK